RWGASSYRIDLVAQHPTDPERFVLAIECDGDGYRSVPTARDRDRLRQQQLEVLGWRYHRIWSTDWFMRRSQEIERAVAAYEAAVAFADSRAAAGAEPVTAVAAEPVAAQAVRGAARAPRPPVPKRETIGEYSDRELDALVRWVHSDGRLRTDDEIVDELTADLGFARRGKRIEEALRAAIQRNRPR
ncbi:MAG: DNA helicase, partial [Bacillota bacterium]